MDKKNSLRIAHLSDIHLSNSNLSDLKNYYLDALCNDLTVFHNEKPIDLIIISGDLVDKGGESLGKNPFNIFETLFINPIQENLGLNKQQFLFVPGNHDINRKEIDVENEFYTII